MRYWYHFVMSLHPLHEEIPWDELWEQTLVMDESKLDDFVANHPDCHNVVMMIDKKPADVAKFEYYGDRHA